LTVLSAVIVVFIVIFCGHHHTAKVSATASKQGEFLEFIHAGLVAFVEGILEQVFP
jgi:hypothetical protein